MIVRTYKFRLYPSDKQQKKIFQNFGVCKEVYNTLLAESKKLWMTKRFNFNFNYMRVIVFLAGFTGIWLLLSNQSDYR